MRHLGEEDGRRGPKQVHVLRVGQVHQEEQEDQRVDPPGADAQVDDGFGGDTRGRQRVCQQRAEGQPGLAPACFAAAIGLLATWPPASAMR